MKRPIVKICNPCAGTGFKLKSAQPIKFKPCNRCGGKGGKVAKP